MSLFIVDIYILNNNLKTNKDNLNYNKTIGTFNKCLITKYKNIKSVKKIFIY